MTIARLAGLALLLGLATAAAPPPDRYLARAAALADTEDRLAAVMLKTSDDRVIRRIAAAIRRANHAEARRRRGAARLDGVAPGMARPDPMQAAFVRDLPAVPRPRPRVRRFVLQQQVLHQQALTLVRDYARAGARPHLRLAARAELPRLRRRIALLDRYAATM